MGKNTGLALLNDGTAIKLIAEEFQADIPKRFFVETEYAEKLWVPRTDIADDMNDANRPKLFYRIVGLQYHYNLVDGEYVQSETPSVYKCWIGPYWGNSKDHIMQGRFYEDKLEQIRNLLKLFAAAERGRND